MAQETLVSILSTQRHLRAAANLSLGGLSRKPLEAKALVVWGKVFDIWMLGQDHRGCKIVSGTWKVTSSLF